MDIRNEEGASGGRYAAEVEGHEAEVTYSRASPKLVIIDHTAVPDALRGKVWARHWRSTPWKLPAPAAGRSSRFAPSSRRKRNAIRNGRMS